MAAHGLDAILSVALGTNPGLLGQLAAGVISNGSLMKFTRDQEADADAKGLPYATRAGYDPSGFVRLFTKLKKGEGPAFLVFLQDHPLPSQRIDAARAEIKRLKHPPETTNAAAYATIKAKL